MRQPMRKDERRAHILHTAKRLFQERGYDNTTIADVISESDIARGTFYLHFDSLEALLTALFEDIVEQAWQRIAPIIDDVTMSSESCTMTVIHTVFDMFAGDPSLGAVFYSGGGQAFVERRQEALFDKLGSLLVEALERRHSRTISHLNWTASMLISLVCDMAYYATRHVSPHDRGKFEEKLIEFVMAGLRKHIDE